MLFDFVATVLRLNRENSVPTQDMEKLQEINRKLMDIMSEYENDPNY